MPTPNALPAQPQAPKRLDSWARLVNLWPRSRKTGPAPDWIWPSGGVINTSCRPTAPPRSETDNRRHCLVRARLASRAKRRWFRSEGRPSALVDIVCDDGQRFRALAREAAAAPLFKLRPGAEIVAVLGSALRSVDVEQRGTGYAGDGICHERLQDLTSETPAWVLIRGVLTHEPPPFPFFAVIGSGHGCGVARFDDHGPPLHLRHFTVTDHSRAVEFALALSKRCPEYLIDVFDFAEAVEGRGLRA
jgi:hypothetical protein